MWANLFLGYVYVLIAILCKKYAWEPLYSVILSEAQNQFYDVHNLKKGGSNYEIFPFVQLLYDLIIKETIKMSN